MKIRIETKHITLEMEDNVVMDNKGFTSHGIPSTIEMLQTTLKEVLNVHCEIQESEREVGS
jgi:hypothetical protein